MQTLEESSALVADATQRFLKESKVRIDAHPSDPRWQLACRIAFSGSLGRSRLLSRFVLFIVDRHIRGRNHEMTEQQIGILVFDRAEGYDSNEDNIVRSYARNLRKRIETYYAEEGQHESLLLDIPRGGYVPVFTPRQKGIEQQVSETESSSLISGSFVAESQDDNPSLSDGPFPVAPAVSWNKKRIWMALLAASIACCVLLFVFHGFGKSSDEAISKNFWRQIFSKDHDTFVVPSDDGLVIMQSLVNRPVPLAAYISSTFRSDAEAKTDSNSPELLKLGRKRFTSVVDLEFASRLAEFHAEVPASHMVVRYARDLRMDDLRTGNAILIGSIESNPWIQLFTNQMNFQQRVSTDPAIPSGLINTHPLAGERAIYGTLGKPHTYGLIVFLPNLTATGSVLIVGGLNTAGTQAATTFVMTPSLMAPVLERARTKTGHLRSFELLVGADDFSSNASAPHVIAERIK
ncbi:hypothetical protein [Terriglobus sp. TAA 43]|uniref:hypothetical protein n=1 Tax=Terriglobus sp. TAA 43 TaxID=278961 RepID=UPI00068C39E8|nr:hypothetical protein [Terriglobus sp. TAA 43]